MIDVFLIRHPEAHRRIMDLHGASYGLNEAGEEQARRIGQNLLEITGGIPTSLERAMSKRSAEAAKLIAGVAGIPTTITEQAAFHRLDRAGNPLSLQEIRANMRGWAYWQREGETNVGVLSRVAIASCLQHILGWTNDETTGLMVTNRSEIPTGSVTRFTIDPDTHEIDVAYYGLTPEEAAKRAA